jgi:hypothetical protein
VGSYYAAETLTQKLGLNYRTIHACAKGCVLFRGDLQDAVHCPKCQGSRYKDEVNKVLPVKVLHHFPIISRLQRMFKTPIMSELMLWHSQNISVDGLARHPL